MGRLGALLGRLEPVLGASWAVLGASWAVLGASGAVLGGGRRVTPDSPLYASPLTTPLGGLRPTNNSTRSYRALSVTCLARDGKRPFFWRGCGIALLSVIPALPPPLPLALLSSYSFHPSSVRCSSACLSLLALLGVILDASWGVLGASWVVLRLSWNSLECSCAVSGPLGLH